MRDKFNARFAEAKSCLRHYYRPVNHEHSRVVIFGQGRSGTTLLERLIASTGYFKAYGELLNSNKRGEIRFPYQYISGRSKLDAAHGFIFHVKIYQLIRDRKRPINPKQFLKQLQQDGWKILYCIRRNKVNHVMSNLVLKQRKSPVKVDDKAEEIRLTVDCEELVSLINERVAFEREERDVLEGLDFHEVVYEDDLEKQEMQQQGISKILAYLSLEDREVYTRLRKVNQQSLSDLIVNYDEFVQCVTENGWQAYLER